MAKKLNYIKDDGGRSKYYKAQYVSDCVTRSIAIASKLDYKEIYNLVKDATGMSPRNGVSTNTDSFNSMMHSLGFTYVKLPKYSTTDDIDRRGIKILDFKTHYAALINSTIHDSWDCRNHKSCIFLLGYWKKTRK